MNRRVKGEKAMEASANMAKGHHDGDGVWFARRLRALARHYVKFEQLPPELRGGLRKGTTHLDDEDVQAHARSWLRAQKLGSITPINFQQALNMDILPNLNIMLKRPLCVRTARRWLVKLGYQLVSLKKGVYMDGHERPDVVAYRNDEFLPKMLGLESRMTQYIGTSLTMRYPDLSDGQRRVIAIFHDESSFHANEYKTTAWYAPCPSCRRCHAQAVNWNIIG